MIKKLMIILSLIVIMYAKPIEVNDYVGNFSLIDQFDKIQTINNKNSILIIASDKSSGSKINKFLSSKKNDFLEKKHTYFIANISDMPSIITKLFALPKMRTYNHSILLLYDNKHHDFIYKDDLISIYTIRNGIVKSIKFIKANEVSSIF